MRFAACAAVLRLHPLSPRQTHRSHLASLIVCCVTMASSCTYLPVCLPTVSLLLLLFILRRPHPSVSGRRLRARHPVEKHSFIYILQFVLDLHPYWYWRSVCVMMYCVPADTSLLRKLKEWLVVVWMIPSNCQDWCRLYYYHRDILLWVVTLYSRRRCFILDDNDCDVRLIINVWLDWFRIFRSHQMHIYLLVCWVENAL